MMMATPRLGKRTYQMQAPFYDQADDYHQDYDGGSRYTPQPAQQSIARRRMRREPVPALYDQRSSMRVRDMTHSKLAGG